MFPGLAPVAATALQAPEPDSATPLLILLPPASSSAAHNRRPLSGATRSCDPASLWTRLRRTSLPGRVFPGHRLSRGTGFGTLQPAGATRAQAGPAPAAPAAPSGFPRPGRPRRQCRGEWRGGRGRKRRPALPSAEGAPDSAGLGRPGGGVHSQPAGATGGPAFSASREPSLSSGSSLRRGLPRRFLGPAMGGSGQLSRNTPSSGTNQAGGHPDSTGRQLPRSGPQPSLWQQIWVCTHCVTLDKSFHLPSFICLIG